MHSFYCKLLVVYLIFATVVCYADVESIECINFENEPYCHDAGYIIIKGSDFLIQSNTEVFHPDDNNQIYFLIDQTVSNSSYIYAQFAYDKAVVPQGPHFLQILKIDWVKRWTSVLFGGFYNSNIPVWTSGLSSYSFHVSGQSTNIISNSTVLEVSGLFNSVFYNHELVFYCTEPGYTGPMPRCSLVDTSTWSLKCTITDATPTNYTFRYLVKEVGADWYLTNSVLLPELHIE